MKRRRLWALGALALAAVLLGNRGFRRMVSSTLELRRLRRQLAALQSEESSLAHQIQQTQKSDRLLETTARRELGYLKTGEVEYRFPPPKKD